jgi:Neprosin
MHTRRLVCSIVLSTITVIVVVIYLVGLVSLPLAPAARASGNGPIKLWYAGAVQTFTGVGIRAKLSQHALDNSLPSQASWAGPSYAGVAVLFADGHYRIEVGWESAAGFHGWPDNQPRLYVRTFDATKDTTDAGCINDGEVLNACGWVQVVNTPQPGTPLTVTPIDDPQEYEIAYSAASGEGRWWVKYQDTWIGYFPSAFSQFGSARWEGWVITSLTTNPPCLDMGNGLYGTEAGAAHITQMELLGLDGIWHTAAPTLSAPAPQYYSVRMLRGGMRGEHSIAYGGPGSVRMARGAC